MYSHFQNFQKVPDLTDSDEIQYPSHIYGRENFKNCQKLPLVLLALVTVILTFFLK